MLARVDCETDEGCVSVAVHRTYLLHDGTGKAPVTPARMALGPTHGGAVRLAEPEGRLAVAEGIETALSVFQETGLPTWAALSASGIEGLVLPPIHLAAEIVIAADSDSAGVAAAERAADRWVASGRRVWIALPPNQGQDFNDLPPGWGSTFALPGRDSQLSQVSRG